MSEFLLYFALPVLVAIVGTSAFLAIREAKSEHIAEGTLPQQPAPIKDAQFYMKNGHWIFGVRSEDPDLVTWDSDRDSRDNPESMRRYFEGR